jgi:hypothetical protein
MEQRYTSKKTILKVESNIDSLWGHIQIRVRKRLDEFWKFFKERLSNEEDKIIQIDDWNDLEFYYENLIVKQVYAMTIQDGLYTKIKVDDEGIDNLIELCLHLPILLSSMLFRDKRKVMNLLQSYIIDLKAMLSPEAKKVLEYYAKAKTTEDKEEFEQIIKSAKENLKSRGIKPAETAVSEFLDYSNSTFRDKLKKLKINFPKI